MPRTTTSSRAAKAKLADAEFENVAGENDGVRERILREATRLFAERGYSGVSIQAISEAVGVTRPTLVYHFGSKDALRREVLGALIGHWQAELPRLIASTRGQPRLDALMGALFQFFLDDQNRARLLLREALDAPEQLEAALREQMQPWIGLLTQTMHAARDDQTGKPALRPNQRIRPETDIESYVMLVATTAIGVLAIGDRTKALVSPEPTLPTQLRELSRIAKIALFAPQES